MTVESESAASDAIAAESQCFLLLYHGIDSESRPAIVTGPALNLIVTQQQLKQHLDWLAGNDLHHIDLDAISQRTIPVNRKTVHLTFDDGHVSNYTHAMPVLLDVGTKATFYVIAGKVDIDPQYVTSEQLQEMSRLGMTIGSHSLTHPFLTLLDENALRRELSDSKRRLEDWIGKAITHFALPGGHYNRAVLAMAREVGYETVATCEIGTVTNNQDLYRLPRIEIRRGLGIAGFANTFNPTTVRRLARVEAAKSVLRKSLGLRNYSRLRSLVQAAIPINR